MRRDLFSNNKPQQEALAKEIATETGMVVRQDGHVKAVKFVLASIVHKQEYALKALKLNLKFKKIQIYIRKIIPPI